jgi:hypothetical protein
MTNSRDAQAPGAGNYAFVNGLSHLYSRVPSPSYSDT